MKMAILMLCSALLGADGEMEELSGKVRVTGRGENPTVSLQYEGGEIALTGELTKQLRSTVTFVVRITGRRENNAFRVKNYVIADIGGGVKPVVGTLLKSEEGDFALRDGDGDAMPLSLRAASKRRLSKMHRALVWMHGEQLVSGEYAVKRYGILQRPPETDGSTGHELPKSGK